MVQQNAAGLDQEGPRLDGYEASGDEPLNRGAELQAENKRDHLIAPVKRPPDAQTMTQSRLDVVVQRQSGLDGQALTLAGQVGNHESGRILPQR